MFKHEILDIQTFINVCTQNIINDDINKRIEPVLFCKYGDNVDVLSVCIK